MFAASNNHISKNAMRQLAFDAGIFYVRRHSSITLDRCPCTPVYRLNGHTAFFDEDVRQRDRLGHLLFLLCYKSSKFPTQDCLSATERRPTKRANRLLSTPTPCGSTPRRAAGTAVGRTPPPCGPTSVTNFSVCVPKSGASGCATRASSSSCACALTEAAASASRPTTSRTCGDGPSKRWPDARRRAAARLPVAPWGQPAGRGTPISFINPA